MSDHNENDIVSRALARRQELEREIQKLDIFLSVYKEISSGSVPLAKSETTVTDGSVAINDAAMPPGVPRPPSGMSQKDFAVFVEEILLENGRPMQPADILEVIHNKGRHVGGVKEWDNHKTKLWRAKQDGKLVIIPGAGYWPATHECPAVGYEVPL